MLKLGSTCAVALSFVVFIGCGDDGSPAADGSAGAGGSNDGSVTDAAMGTDSAAMGTDSAAMGTDSATAAGPTIPAMGDVNCLIQRMEANQWTYGYDTQCVVTVAKVPPISAMVKGYLESYCGSVLGGMVVPSCPRENVIAYCAGGFSPGDTLATKLVYKSKYAPDAEHVAANQVAFCAGAMTYSAAGMAVPRTCKGTISAKVDGQVVSFSDKRACYYKTDGVKSNYFIEGFSAAGNKLVLSIIKENGAYTYQSDALAGTAKGASYLEAPNNAFILPTDAAARTLQVTKWEAAGAGVAGSFSLGEYKNGSNVARTITEGTLDLQIAAP